MSNSRSRLPGVLSVLLVVFLLAGCATTGRGNFPTFYPEEPGQTSLAVVPPLGASSRDLRSSILYHLNRGALSRRFKSVEVVPEDRVNEIMDPGFSIDQLAWMDSSRLKQLTGADLILLFEVHEFAIKQFSTTETRTLISTKSRNRNTSVNSEENVYINTYETELSSREVPVKKGNLRVVLSLSAALYDTDKGNVVWQGRRIERAEDELEDLSSLELKDIVVERLMYRINYRLAP
ncbi:MAG: hypothetical protein ABEK50_05300 [bacterium]